MPAVAAGARVDRYIAEVAATVDMSSPLYALTRARLRVLAKEGAITCRGERLKPSSRLAAGETVQIVVPDPQPLNLTPEPMDLCVLYEDAHIIAVAKPAGLAVHPGAGRARGTLVHGLLAHCGDLSGIGGKIRPGIVHRLDLGTSGVIVAAKHDAAHEGLAKQFAARRVGKDYVAVVCGYPSPPSGTIETFFGRHPKDRKRFTGRLDSGRRAITTFRVEAMAAGLSVVRVRIGTGRTHQIRVHLREYGVPLVGDPLYGVRSPRVTDAQLRVMVDEFSHQALHAARLCIAHPIKDTPLVLEAALPENLAALVGRIRELAAQSVSLQ